MSNIDLKSSSFAPLCIHEETYYRVLIYEENDEVIGTSPKFSDWQSARIWMVYDAALYAGVNVRRVFARKKTKRWAQYAAGGAMCAISRFGHLRSWAIQEFTELQQ